MPDADLERQIAQSIDDLTDEEALSHIGCLIDTSADVGSRDGLDRGVELCNTLRVRSLRPDLAAVALYFEANAWEDLRRLQRSGDELWEWEQPEYQQQIILLRTAQRLSDSSETDPYRRAQIATNLGNLLSHVGRTVEGLRLWNAALKAVPDFPMAVGNRGRGLFYLAQRTHDPGHQFVLMQHAYSDLAHVVAQPLHDHAADAFRKVILLIEQFYGRKRLLEPTDLHSFSLGESEEEISYRKWVGRLGLFLSPLNDLGDLPIATADPLNLPGITLPVSEGPYYIGFFNQMKQEYASSRYLLYDGLELREPHFSDRRVKLANTLDYPVYGLGIEEVKSSFRIAYSLFDKIAFFLNHYLEIKIPEHRVNFRSLWYTKQERKAGVRLDVVRRRNVALQGLFWLSKDLFEQDEEFRDAIEPNARELAAIRNHLEHKYLKVHQTGWVQRDLENPIQRGLTDTLAHSVSFDRLRDSTLQILTMARAGLLYLTQAIYLEESKREDTGKGLVMPMFLDDLDDEWKGSR